MENTTISKQPYVISLTVLMEDWHNKYRVEMDYIHKFFYKVKKYRGVRIERDNTPNTIKYTFTTMNRNRLRDLSLDLFDFGLVLEKAKDFDEIKDFSVMKFDGKVWRN